MKFKYEYPYTVIILHVPMPISPGSELWGLYDESCDSFDSPGNFLAIEMRHVESHFPFVASARFGRRDGAFVCARNLVEQDYTNLGIEAFLRELAEATEQDHLGPDS